MGNYSVSINSWDEYQERPDRANYSWFKFHSNALTGHFWQRSTAEEKVVWLCLLSLRNRQDDDVVYFNELTLAGYCNIAPKKIEEILNRLAELDAITIQPAHTAAINPADNAGENPPVLRGEEKRVDESRLTPTWIANKWNEVCGEIYSIRSPQKLDKKRLTQIRERLKENPNSGDWIAALTRVANSTKCQGLENEPGRFDSWKANFDWFIKPGRLEQILEGKWDGKASKPQGKHPFVEQMERGGS